MKINIISIESSRPDWAQKAFNSYKQKFNKSIEVVWIGCKPSQRSRNYNVSSVVKKKALRWFQKLKKET